MLHVGIQKGVCVLWGQCCVSYVRICVGVSVCNVGHFCVSHVEIKIGCLCVMEATTAC